MYFLLSGSKCYANKESCVKVVLILLPGVAGEYNKIK